MKIDSKDPITTILYLDLGLPEANVKILLKLTQDQQDEDRPFSSYILKMSLRLFIFIKIFGHSRNVKGTYTYKYNETKKKTLILTNS